MNDAVIWSTIYLGLTQNLLLLLAWPYTAFILVYFVANVTALTPAHACLKLGS